MSGTSTTFHALIGRLKGVEPLALLSLASVSGGVLFFQWLAGEVLEG